ncbi:hypothetical protein HPB50_006632 [Hyalomma asiaticum]|uniref:Uncharacterized protein n=1 Tax=Hyalomma asiaticum TaxID=266040 RepID=A0ACB7T6D3_HYAAI|nr:hypothetical protein HPB50_006632 [Hyalomma asiaticum]
MTLTLPLMTIVAVFGAYWFVTCLDALDVAQPLPWRSPPLWLWQKPCFRCRDAASGASLPAAGMVTGVRRFIQVLWFSKSYLGPSSETSRCSAPNSSKAGSYVDEVLVSFDVKSLFASVPKDLAVKVCTAVLDSDPTLPERTPFDVPDLSRVRQFCLGNTYFTLQQSFFKQVHETAMGASISVTAADLTLE